MLLNVNQADKDIVLVGDAVGTLPVMMKTIRDQIVLLAGKHDDDGFTSSLAHMNCFVGYKANKLKIGFQVTKGTLRTFK